MRVRFDGIWSSSFSIGSFLQWETPRAPSSGLVSDKGFGFVAAQDGKEYFFHQSACVSTPFNSLREGQSVTFDPGQGPKGPRAENVTPA